MATVTTLLRILCIFGFVQLLLIGVSGAPTPVTGPIVITSPGYYVMANDITSSTPNSTIDIRSSDVIFDGMNHIIDGTNRNITLTNDIIVGGFLTLLNNVTIRNVTVKNRSHGIFFVNVTNSHITNCNINQVGQDGIRLQGSNHIEVTGNKITYSLIRGISLTSSDSVQISSNDINNNQVGIRLESSANNQVFNNFFDNIFNIGTPTTGNTWNITKTSDINIINGPYIGGNFWSDYTGVDTDGDSLGNTMLPYTSNGNITSGGDWLPLLHPPRVSSRMGIFRPSTGFWYFDWNLDGIVDTSFRFGGSTDQTVVGDWQGIGHDDIAIFRPSTGYWYFDNLDGIVDKSFRYGGSSDRIIVGKWQGPQDGIAIFRPSTGYWYFDSNLDGIVNKSFRFGGSTDQIIAGDWDGDGLDGIAIFRPSTGYWYFDYNLDGIVNKSFRYGGSSDRIIVGKWQGTNDGIAIFRPSTGYWYFDYNLDGAVDKSFRYGGSSDQIITGDWLGTGNESIAIFRPSTGYWYIDYNLDGIVDKSIRFGGSTDRILTGRWP
jgi:parallel beta-helix repeat protein